MIGIKRFVARLFNIQPEDLPASSQVIQQSSVSPEVKIEISREIDQQLKSTFQDLILPALEQGFDERIKAALAHLLPEQVVVPVADDTMGTVPDDVTQDEAITEDEFPLVEDVPVSPIVEEGAETSELIALAMAEAPILPEEVATPEILTVQVVQQPLLTFEEVLPLQEAKPEKLPQAVRPRLTSIRDKTLRLGIDFGTTTTAVSIKVGDELPVALPIGSDGVTRYIPSVVYFVQGNNSLDGRVVVGEEAESFGDQALVVRSVKRCLACTGKGCQDSHTGENPFPWCRGDGRIQVSETETLPPEKVAYYIIREALSRAITLVREGWQIDLTQANVVMLPLNLGCSAKFNFTQREIIRKVSKELGFFTVHIENVIEEPILAGFTFSRFAENPLGRALIYDFGGGTFDVAILEVDRSSQDLRVTVLTTAGDNWLGGDDIDTLVYKHIIEHTSGDFGIPPEQVETDLGAIDRSRLRITARRAKEQLSTSEEFRDVLFSEKLGPVNIGLSRSEFEHLLKTSGLVDKSLAVVRDACQLAYTFENARTGNLLDYQAILRYELKDANDLIDKVILVGGITKIPYIRQRLEQTFPGNIVSETVIEPISAVAIGGAYPRGPQHYSLSTPPYGFFLSALNSETKRPVIIPIFEPFEYLDFHDMWRVNARPAYIKHIQITPDLRNVKLYYKRAGTTEKNLHNELGTLQSGSWRFGITLDGDMFYEMVGGKCKDLSPYPTVHPVQQAIKKANEDRLKKQQEVKGNYEDWMRDTMSEN